MADQSIQVTSKQVFSPKRDKEQGASVSSFNTVSIPDQRSANGFSTFPALKEDIEVKDNGYCNVTVHLDKEYDLSYPNGTKKEDGKPFYQHDRVSGQQLVDLLQENLGKKKEQEKPKNVFVNNVPTEFITPVNGKEGQPELSRVSFKGVEGNYFSIILPKQQTEIQSTTKAGLPIANRHNINLGPEDTVHNCSTRQADGKFTYFKMTSGEIKSQYEAQQKAYMQERRSADKADKPLEAAVEAPEQGAPHLADDDYIID